jgi:hypothetical protein
MLADATQTIAGTLCEPSGSNPCTRDDEDWYYIDASEDESLLFTYSSSERTDLLIGTNSCGTTNSTYLSNGTAYDSVASGDTFTLTTGERIYFTVERKVGNVETSYKLNVTRIPNRVFANDDSVLSLNEAVDINVTANDTGGAGAIDPSTVTIVTGPTHGSVNVNPVTGVVTYTPGASYDTGDSFTYTVDNNLSTTSNTATVKIRNVIVGFEFASYSVAENTSLPDNDFSVMPMKITLSEAIPRDLNITYATSDGTATSAEDYNAHSASVNIPAGETEWTIYIDIIHDVPIELDEEFYVNLTNPQPGALGISTATVTITAQTTAPLCYSDDFDNAQQDDEWRLLYSNGTYTPQITNKRMRLTEAVNNIATAITRDYEFAAQYNLLIVEFKQYAYGGTVSWAPYGADGIGMVLYDTSVGPDPVPGAFGGSLGYAQRTSPDSVNGFQGGWLGLGLDEYGNYANPTEGRIGGPGFTLNAVSIRGDGNGTTGYEYLAGTGSLSTPLANRTASDYFGGQFRLTVDSRDPTKLLITLERDINDGNGYQTIINRFDAKNHAGQGPTPDFVRMALTASTGSANNVHEIDDLSVWGVCREYVQDINISNYLANVDIVDGYSTAGGSYIPWIQTKVSRKDGYTLDAVYLGDDLANPTPTTYQSNVANANQASSITVLYKLADMSGGATCQSAPVIDLFTTIGGNTPVVSVIQPLMVSDTSNSFVMAYAPDGATPLAKKDVRFKYKSIDFNQLILDSGINCAQKSSTGGVVEGIPACLIANPNDNQTTQNTAIENYKRIFGQNAYDNCYDDNGNPCWASNGGIGSAPYDHPYGCFECSIGEMPYICSKDNFAIRPERYSVSSTQVEFPNLLRAAEDYNLTVHAYDFGTTTDSQDYNQTGGPGGNISLDQDLLLRDGTIDTGSLLNGTLAWSVWDFNMTNGLSNRTGVVGNEVAGVQFDDVGQVVLKVQDRNWAAVDINNASDPTPIDCTADGAWICGDDNVTYIPFEFGLVDVNISNNNGDPGSFTYISNLVPGDTTTYNMAARVEVEIQSLNKNGVITQNFRDGAQFYENPVGVTFTAIDIDKGAGNTTIIDPALLGFGTGGDENGTKTLDRNESNLTQVLRFNFTRARNVPLNPFDLNVSELNITAISDYTDPVDGDTAQIDGSTSGVGNGTAAFYYGRLHSPRYRIPGNSGTVRFYYEVYCSPQADVNGTTCDVNSYGSGTPLAGNVLSIDDIRWYINGLHTVTDGNTTAVTGRTTLINNEVNNLNPTQPGYPNWLFNYTGNKGYPFKGTMEMSTQDWLLYHRFNPTVPTNSFELEFNNIAGQWGGTDTSGVAVDSNASLNTNRRIEW